MESDLKLWVGVSITINKNVLSLSTTEHHRKHLLTCNRILLEIAAARNLNLEQTCNDIETRGLILHKLFKNDWEQKYL